MSNNNPQGAIMNDLEQRKKAALAAFATDIETLIRTAQQPRHEWKTIDSAPRDGNEYLGWFPDLNERRVIWWCSAANFSVPLKGNADGFWNSSRHSVNQPTHWQPLPEPPKEK